MHNIQFLQITNHLFCFADYITTEAAKILRLLHIRELRELQNSANEAIVAVQGVTANPKTDTKLGKVGRS
jgi:RLL motif-containing protein 1